MNRLSIHRRVIVVGLSLGVALLISTGARAADVDAAGVMVDGESVTYGKQISRLVQKRCQECHHANGIGPFSLTNYRQVRGWSKMIKEVVSEGRMPPWHADPNVGKFYNDRSLSQHEKDMLVGWIDGGMPRGDAADLPEPIEFHNEWRIGEPDVIFEMPEEVVIEPTGVVPYKYFVTETNFTEDKWVNMAQSLPGNPKVVHHIIIFVRDPNDAHSARRAGQEGQGFFDAFAPGSVPMRLEPGLARKIPAGASLIWQLHYTPTGKRETDRSRFGIKFYEGPVEHAVMTNEAIDFGFEIPAQAKNHRVEADLYFARDAVLFDMSPHMHYRGKSFEYSLIDPDGNEEMILSIPEYDFNWQTTYKLAEPLNIKKGSKLHCVAHFDNSSDNPYNPDPDKAVRWGDQTWEEMMIGFFNFSWAD